MLLRLFLRRVIRGILVRRKTGRLSRFHDFIFQLFGIIGVVVAGIWIAEVLRQLTIRQ